MLMGWGEGRGAHLEQLLCNIVVGTLGEVTASDVVSTAEMDTEMHVCGALKALVVELDVSVEHLIGCLVVVLVGGPALQHRFRAEV